jgi:hypothetical protein
MLLKKGLRHSEHVWQNAGTNLTRRMKKTLLSAVIGLGTAVSSLFAQQSANLSFSGPTSWVPGTSVTLSVTDNYTGFDSYGLSYWLEVSSAFAPFLRITGLTYFTFHDGNNIGTFPFSFSSTSGADSGFMTTTTANGQSGDLGATSQPPQPPATQYHITDITFALAPNAPIGTYTLRTTTASPRLSIQVTSNFGDFPISQAPFVFSVVPEPSTFTLLGLAGVGAGAIAYRRGKA